MTTPAARTQDTAAHGPDTAAAAPDHRIPAGVFRLPGHLTAKADPALVAGDEGHFADIAAALERSVAELTHRLAAERRAPARSGSQALDRDEEIHRLTARLRLLRRSGLDLCLGRMVRSDEPEPVYVGRIGLTDGTGRRLLVDWRAPAAEPFFAATHAHPMGLVSRRRYRWTRGGISDYWDEVFGPEGVTGTAALDDHSAFLAGLGRSRTARMQDVLATIQTDQDAVIRAGSRGVLVVDGGPGTGKTVVALHRCAHLLYREPRLVRDGGVLVVGPHRPYLGYVADVLPGLGEDGVRLCTLRDLVAEGAAAVAEDDPEVARLKSSAAMVRGAVEAAVRFHEEPPVTGLVVETDWDEVRLTGQDWARAFDAPDPGTPHNTAREQVLDELVEILLERHRPGVPAEAVRAALRRNPELLGALRRAWPLVEAADLVADLWSVPAYLRRCASWLDAEQVQRLQRPDPQRWTLPDLPLLDAARQRLGDPAAARHERRWRAEAAVRAASMAAVVDHLIESDDSEMAVMSMLRGQDLQQVLADDGTGTGPDPDGLAGPFGHVVVDEAQELTDAEWQMVLSRCPSRSLTVVGDRAQARHGFLESWQERLTRVGAGSPRSASLRINYRTPREVMVLAEPVIRAVLPDAGVPTSVRSSGRPVVHAAATELTATLDEWLGSHAEGTVCVVGDPAVRSTGRVRSLPPQLCKGLEFDLVVLVDPDRWGTGVEGAVDRYVAMTRATQHLVVLHSGGPEAVRSGGTGVAR
ncbi:RNA polymerase recycling motor ATPase HelR [Nakamurella endophytica]|uniref:DNA helicase n=1 Tax=Nakamurella endophytica TaxID=1748367 RepID=A0A917TDA6_9ACTN|nr:RNA polymerase recycling motor ATPase HelR [Nakamurella endophytica]GGM19209.1 DNA helicase [Nakamurella endophytica]